MSRFFCYDQGLITGMRHEQLCAEQVHEFGSGSQKGQTSIEAYIYFINQLCRSSEKLTFYLYVCWQALFPP